MATERLREVGVMGSARLKEGDIWWARAFELGSLLAAEGFAIVTGGYGGLMAAVSRGAHERSGHVIGLPMRRWEGLQPNQWNAELRWVDGYGPRLALLLQCDAVIALPGGIGTLSEMAVVWASIQTERPAPPLVLLGECWPPVIRSIREHLVVDDGDVGLLTFAETPQEAVAAVRAELEGQRRVGVGPRG